jgi:hypothetical protein
LVSASSLCSDSGTVVVVVDVEEEDMFWVWFGVEVLSLVWREREERGQRSVCLPPGHDDERLPAHKRKTKGVELLQLQTRDREIERAQRLSE